MIRIEQDMGTLGTSNRIENRLVGIVLSYRDRQVVSADSLWLSNAPVRRKEFELVVSSRRSRVLALGARLKRLGGETVDASLNSCSTFHIVLLLEHRASIDVPRFAQIVTLRSSGRTFHFRSSSDV